METRRQLDVKVLEQQQNITKWKKVSVEGIDGISFEYTYQNRKFQVWVYHDSNTKKYHAKLAFPCLVEMGYGNDIVSNNGDISIPPSDDIIEIHYLVAQWIVKFSKEDLEKRIALYETLRTTSISLVSLLSCFNDLNCEPLPFAEGGEATIYQGTYKSDKVAIKIYKGSNGFETEFNILCQLSNHPNIIDLLAGYDYPIKVMVTRFMSKGNLSDFLTSKGILSHQEIVNLAAGIISGVNFLHENKIIHRDLKTTNILLDEGDIPKIADFGISLAPRHQTSTIYGTIHWMAPEMFDGIVSQPSDVYAFGIIFWELHSCESPYSNFSSGESLKQHVLSGNRPPIKSSWNQDYVQLMKKCWHQNPQKRPSFSLLATIFVKTDI